MLTEAAIRDSLRREVKARLGLFETIDEFWMPRTNARADLAAIGSHLWGFEIKTDRDTLRRLPRQVEAYSRLFDWCVVVVAERHLDDALAVVPQWWGAAVVLGDQAPLSFKVVRWPQPNQGVDPETIVRLLWREEARSLLSALGAPPDITASRVAMWQQLLTVCDIDELKAAVRGALLARDASRRHFPSRQLRQADVRH